MLYVKDKLLFWYPGKIRWILWTDLLRIIGITFLDLVTETQHYHYYTMLAQRMIVITVVLISRELAFFAAFQNVIIFF